MRKTIQTTASLLIISCLAPFVSPVRAAAIYKTADDNNLNLTTSWVTNSLGVVHPSNIGATDALIFDNTMGASRALSLGDDMTVGGLRLDGTSGYHLTINSGNTLTLNGASATDIAYAGAGFVLNSAAGGTLTVNCDVIVNTAQQWVSSRALTINGNTSLGTNTLTLNAAGAGIITLAGIVTGSKAAGNNALFLSSSIAGGTVRLLNPSNSFTGNIELGGGLRTILEFNSAGSLGNTAQLRFRNTGGTGSILRYTGNTAAIVPANFQCDSSLGIRLESDSVGGSVTFSGTWNASSSSRPVALGGSGTGDNTISGSIIGSTLTKYGSGKWILAAANSYAGGTTLSGGTLGLGNNGALGSGSLNITGAATLLATTNLSGTSKIANPVTMGGNLTIDGDRDLELGGTLTSSGSNSRTLTVRNGGLTILSGHLYLAEDNTTTGRTLTLDGDGVTVISGNIHNNNFGNTVAAGLTINNAAAHVILSGVNDYTGATLVNAGTLFINGTHTASDITIHTGTFGGTGTVGNVIINGGTLSPGNSVGTLTVGNLTLTNGVQLAFELGTPGASDLVIVTNALSFTGMETNWFILSAVSGFGVGTYTLFDALSYGSSTLGSGTNFDDIAGTGLSGYLWLDPDNQDVKLTVVPEPSAGVLVGMGLFTLLALRRWRGDNP